MKILLRFILFCCIGNSLIFAQYRDTLFLAFKPLNMPKAVVRQGSVEDIWGTGKKEKDYNIFSNNIDYKILSGAGLIFLGSGTYLHIVQSNAWWSRSDRFRSAEAPKELFSMKKINHIYGVNLLGHLFSGGYEAAGMQALESTWFSSLSALSYELYIELEDGFHQGQGFSYSDMGADLFGTAFYIGQYYYPVLKSFQPKISYRPSEGIKSSKKILFDDYSGQKYWISVRVKEFIPEKVSEYWPSFINTAVGADFRDGEPGKISSIYLALDLDAEKLPLYGPFWQFIKNTLNYIHFPMPGIRLTPKATSFLLCF